MVEKSRQRGRPRSYDPEAALDRAAQLFWAKGYADTSLDELGAAMGMGRPSIYHAFGDKEALFLRALERYRETVGFAPLRAMQAEESVRDGLDAFFGQIVEYTTADRSHLGCLLGGTAAVTDLAGVQAYLKANFEAYQTEIVAYLSAAVRRGQLPSGYPAAQGARRAVNAMLSLSARARLGTPRAQLLADAADATAQVLDLQPATRRAPRAKRTQREPGAAIS
jgi:AcrR family transcriptional regulator